MMEKANLPTERASEPHEEARQPLADTMTPRLERRQLSRKLITFADDADSTPKSSQKSSNYKEVLSQASQPVAGLSHRQKLLWLQKRRTTGLWVQCDDCQRWRFLQDVLDSSELPNKWYCRMNPDTAHADCSIPEASIRVREEEDLIYSKYSAGSVVWVYMPGWPWWPAMVDDCPDTEQFYWLDGFSDIPTHYNVVFFDSKDVTRAWVAPDNIKPYTAYKNSYKSLAEFNKKYKTRLLAAVTQADDALRLPLADRLQKYSFVARYKGILNTPKTVTKKDNKKHQKYLKRKFDIELEASDEDTDTRSPVRVNENVIVLAMPKKVRSTANRIGNIRNDDVTDLLQNPNSTKVVKLNLENVDKTETEVTETSINIFKQPNSLAVQVGNTIDSTRDLTEPFDNDTSKTYVPEEAEQFTQLTLNDTPRIPKIHVRIASPNSDDFEF